VVLQIVNAACMHGKLEWRSCVCMLARGPTRLFSNFPTCRSDVVGGGGASLQVGFPTVLFSLTACMAETASAFFLLP
jgi:hypothetical protein